MTAYTAHPDLRVLIVANNASLRFGGEAALPLHYFRMLRGRGIAAWLAVHERTRAELESIFASERERLLFVPDTRLHRALWHLGTLLPANVAEFTTGFLIHCATQLAQRHVIRRLVREQGITVIHQPTPVSPKLPSLIYDLGAPVIVGPMNGGLDYPPAFRDRTGIVERLTLAIGRRLATLSNWLIPGKRRAALLLVANHRTQAALPDGLCGNVLTLVENGVDLDLWQRPGSARDEAEAGLTRFVYVGRLVDWKGVDLLLEAFRRASARTPMTLSIIGDGAERDHLQQLSRQLGLASAEPTAEADRCMFLGWMSQADCAPRLRDYDVLILPSLRECGGAVVLEAMAAQMPVIATAWGGPVDYLDATCGLLVEPLTRESFIQGLASAMLHLAQNPEQRRAMGKAGSLKVAQQFDWQAKVDRMLGLYRATVDRARIHSESY